MLNKNQSEQNKKEMDFSKKRKKTSKVNSSSSHKNCLKCKFAREVEKDQSELTLLVNCLCQKGSAFDNSDKNVEKHLSVTYLYDETDKPVYCGIEKNDFKKAGEVSLLIDCPYFERGSNNLKTRFVERKNLQRSIIFAFDPTVSAKKEGFPKDKDKPKLLKEQKKEPGKETEQNKESGQVKTQQYNTKEEQVKYRADNSLNSENNSGKNSEEDRALKLEQEKKDTKPGKTAEPEEKKAVKSEKTKTKSKEDKKENSTALEYNKKFHFSKTLSLEEFFKIFKGNVAVVYSNKDKFLYGHKTGSRFYELMFDYKVDSKHSILTG